MILIPLSDNNGSLQERVHKKYDPSGFGKHVVRRRFNVKLIDPLAPSDNL